MVSEGVSKAKALNPNMIHFNPAWYLLSRLFWSVLSRLCILYNYDTTIIMIQCYGNYYLLFLVLLRSCLIRLEIPLVGGVALIWARSAERCGRQPLRVSFGWCGRKEIGSLLIMRSYWWIGWKILLFVIFGCGLNQL